MSVTERIQQMGGGRVVQGVANLIPPGVSETVRDLLDPRRVHVRLEQEWYQARFEETVRPELNKLPLLIAQRAETDIFQRSGVSESLAVLPNGTLLHVFSGQETLDSIYAVPSTLANSPGQLERSNQTISKPLSVYRQGRPDQSITVEFFEPENQEKMHKSIGELTPDAIALDLLTIIDGVEESSRLLKRLSLHVAGGYYHLTATYPGSPLSLTSAANESSRTFHIPISNSEGIPYVTIGNISDEKAHRTIITQLQDNHMDHAYAILRSITEAMQITNPNEPLSYSNAQIIAPLSVKAAHAFVATWEQDPQTPTRRKEFELMEEEENLTTILKNLKHSSERHLALMDEKISSKTDPDDINTLGKKRVTLQNEYEQQIQEKTDELTLAQEALQVLPRDLRELKEEDEDAYEAWLERDIEIAAARKRLLSLGAKEINPPSM